MSLILRQKCQEKLDDFGLGHLHCIVNNNYKLSIVSECGKPFMTIQGIQFNRATPKLAEISYAVELLDNFMGLHGKDILNFIRAEKNFTNKKKPNDKRFDCRYNDVAGEYNSTKTIKDNFSICVYTDQIFKVIIPSNSKLERITYKNNISNFKSLIPIKKFKHNKKLMAEAYLFIKKFHNYETEQLNVINLKSKLSVCDV